MRIRCRAVRRGPDNTRRGGETLGVCVRIPVETVESVKKYRAAAPLEAMAAYTVDYAGIQGHVYTLLLESGNYYVGWSSAVEYRIAQHFCGASSTWTMQHKPLQVLACVAGDTRLEDIVTISLMSQFGWERVRGGRWCQLALEGPPDAVMRAMAPQKPRPDPCNGHAAPDGGACSASRGTAQDGEPAPPQPGEQEVQGERETIAITRA